MLTKKEQHIDPDLPEHVVLNILCRLPVKSLIRFTCVCKRWHSLIISDRQFGNSHFQLSSHLRQHVLIATPRMSSTQFQCLDDNFTTKKLTCPLELTTVTSNTEVMGSCDGLVLLGQFNRNCLVPLVEFYCDYYRSLVIWNPSTKFVRKIPLPKFQIGMIKLADERKKRHMSCVYYGFGRVSASDDYKLVVIPNFGGFMEVQVFSYRANSWKVVKAPYLSPYPFWSKEWGTYSNGAIHWVSDCEPGFEPPPVYAFDLDSEQFGEMPLPVFSHNEDGIKMTRVRTPVLVGGCLCVMFQDPDKYSEFWVMKEYKMPESWVKLFRFNVRDLPDVFAPNYNCYYWDPIFLSEDGTIVIKLHMKLDLVRIICCKDNAPVCTDRYRVEVPEYMCSFNAHFYHETLVSVPE
ncbi:F-box protein CPR1-like [Argentina anserina]|uniref:F-box protein CPR1-like n=1 Tax=Argentina anserina TaxID=57926 RepID=UPI0021765E25|nr:F-box protein CPR1-like [Potentilla anserina]XP_050377482.1 F-box protein CPR1-like [Potentilla anserina]XP_050377483.1 F-box protein CPR1-like [Potentilla anserina]